MATLTENITDLKRLLGNQLIDGPSFAQHPIRQSINRVFTFHDSGDYASRDYENSSISLIVKNLKEIENHDKKLLTVFRQALRSCNNDTYFGIRFEISVAASLLRSKVTFIKTERPDFALLESWDGICIECGSAHLSKSKIRIADLKYKIGSVIREKSQYDYCNASNALFIDFTNINYHGTLQETLPSVDELKHYVSDQLERSDFGSVVLWTYIINLDIRRYQWKYTRVDNKMPNPLLKRFLDALYPFGHDVTHDYGFLFRG
jgi:hypothetical protein